MVLEEKQKVALVIGLFDSLANMRMERMMTPEQVGRTARIRRWVREQFERGHVLRNADGGEPSDEAVYEFILGTAELIIADPT